MPTPSMYKTAGQTTACRQTRQIPEDGRSYQTWPILTDTTQRGGNRGGKQRATKRETANRGMTPLQAVKERGRRGAVEERGGGEARRPTLRTCHLNTMTGWRWGGGEKEGEVRERKGGGGGVGHRTIQSVSHFAIPSPPPTMLRGKGVVPSLCSL